jgi:glutaredoxin
MKKWIVIFALGLVGMGYLAYQRGLLHWPEQGAFDADGKPIARLFVESGCGKSCDEVKELLRTRRIAYELVDLSRPGAEKHGIRQFPLLLVGAHRIVGNDSDRIVSALAESFGPEVLSANEQLAMRNHFDEQGKPIVVMYATKSCPDCSRQREFFEANHIDYYEIDVEESNSGKLAYDMLHGNGYPMSYVGYRRFEGYVQDEIRDALRELH